MGEEEGYHVRYISSPTSYKKIPRGTAEVSYYINNPPPSHRKTQQHHQAPIIPSPSNKNLDHNPKKSLMQLSFPVNKLWNFSLGIFSR